MLLACDILNKLKVKYLLIKHLELFDGWRGINVKTLKTKHENFSFALAEEKFTMPLLQSTILWGFKAKQVINVYSKT